ncbi:MAG TPA: hypothetical protein VGP68_16345 [Gemmataceae bacterium]|jgi:hypothetical protein|nr:hypothetical protein [Gemmataceae bacterium]
MLTEQASQGIAIPTTMVPPESTSSTVTTGGIDTVKFRRVMFIVGVGTFGSSATVDGKLQSSPDNSTWTDIAGSNLTQLLAAGGNNKVAIMEISMAMLASLAPTARYVRGSVTVGTAATLVTIIPLGVDAAQKPGSQFNDASVVQKVVL